MVKRKWLCLISGLVLSGLTATTAQALTCNEIKGYALSVAPSSGGFIEDGIQGSFEFLKLKSGETDIRSVDALGSFSYREDGWTIHETVMEGGSVQIAADFPGKNHEVFHLIKDGDERWLLLYSQQKSLQGSHGLAIAAKLFRGTCTRG